MTTPRRLAAAVVVATLSLGTVAATSAPAQSVAKIKAKADTTWTILR